MNSLGGIAWRFAVTVLLHRNYRFGARVQLRHFDLFD
jgi:hypothetical protein